MLNFLPFLLSASSLADVVGGTPAKPGAWPDAVAVIAPTAACTGTLITPDVVLTAGHCIASGPGIVLLDTVDYAAPGGEAIEVKWSQAYPDWEHAYDVGVVVLAHPARTRPRPVAAACTARSGLVAGASVELVGFGLTTPAGTGQNSRLHEARLPVDDPTCAGGHGCNKAIAPGGEFTAGGHGIDACFGDSGGPVYADAPGGPALLGVVSRGAVVAGAPCGGGGVFVRADKVVAWIEQVTHETVSRARCARDGEADGDADPAASEPDAGGCAAGGGTGGLLGAVSLFGALGALGRARRARRAPQTA